MTELEADSIGPPEIPRGSAAVPDLADMFNEMFERSSRLQGKTLAVAIFFFSLSEVVFDAAFALSDRFGVSYRAFRQLDWSERFKLVVGLDDKETEMLYVKLRNVRRLYRNIPVHADPLFLFSVTGVGLIPASLESLDDPNVKPVFLGGGDDATLVLESLTAALDLLEEHPRTRFGFAYAESGLIIHLKETDLSELRRHMGSIEAFRDELEKRVAYADAVINMEV